jgi:DNA-binding HxlR family transcriptional regulator
MDTVSSQDRRPPFVPSACPVDRTLRVLSGPWKALILYNLRLGPRRFNELRRLIPAITQRMLTQHLRELEADGILHRHVHEVVPPHVEYSLTPLGLTLLPILDAMAVWGLHRLAEDAAVAA